ncbi:glutathione S-transferase family protein [Floridanema aerugineum]|jgi:glutathione S-transferase|uniref:Glutathione S-transferase family protein n=1 Tax=Floridaenema aerugineum BLCC-F46 TaxID=3153654 RepID=A0ABV4X7G7_9CYAN
MVKFYFSPISVNARRVWVALLEKEIAFEPVQMKLDGDHFQAEFTAINPLQRVPVIVDDGFTVVESLAILDYLEAKYATPSLMPQEAQAIAKVRMVEMIAVNEIQPATVLITKQMVGLEVESAKLEAGKERINTILQFYENLLGDNTYFAGEMFSLAEVVAGTLLESLPMFGIAIDIYPKLNNWLERLQTRESFQQTTASRKEIHAVLPHIKKILATR